ncbi:MAG: YicC/YloC family endoribonuclease [Peptoniphilus harei]|uniref:YicC/YloC family endoribonuclease n=1 Tax=Peptoniphilus harei TaxID=54005 RepID=UPI00254C2E29|nr:YicC/YloC family endoribonuclease [Peptoniphilus harei]MDK7755272.1 YicC/YloC family endoribonuclease [Peptoniphilus harei]MDK7761506.1 YicC/YloC family endoribonuclease [Peptoniphilus harei]MDK8271032.1 YicC/YloC family endoribonuclease [Peptoniphilus harei]MDK8339380.1 YicC/YloC family endoribonuclease [Peptoniphilus harei]
MNSMTGYGLFEKKCEDFYIKVEMKSVNNRYLDMNVRMPGSIMYAEEAVRSFIKSKIKRGKVDIFINFEYLDSSQVEIDIDYELLNKYISISKELEENYGLSSDLSFSKIMKDSNIVKAQKADFDGDYIKEELLKVLDGAAKDFLKSRAFEGEKIREDFKVKLDEVERLTYFVEERAPISLKENENRLRERVAEFLQSSEVNEDRILTEIAIMLDKLSIDEEITRLKIHIQNFNDIINEEGPIGRKLDFLIQELNREANTIGSKSNDIEITSAVVMLKSEIEKLREQAQNVE